ncbi:hypothetical protein EDC22_10436 [Tepidamorphus gemmatus]|uniref:DUF4105 domain-containing protein n=2 Tax=Tepidamorphus gemmatus TaxID=747076 RepID=A0A4R3ME68_9HYPH|nr:hypothetical protein EDC22_10436 [Tepidamorphus gemmatus]
MLRCRHLVILVSGLLLGGCNMLRKDAPSYMLAFADDALADPALEAPVEDDEIARPGDFVVEFRARTGPDIVGHTFIAYGRVAEDNTIADEMTAGLYPKDNIGGFVFGITGTESTMTAVPLDELIPPSIVFRHRLTSDEYARLLAAIEAARADPPDWSWVGYNCNSFVADMARVVDLKVPAGATFLAPMLLVSELKRLNSD